MNVKKYITIVVISVFVCLAIVFGIITAKFMTKPFTVGDHGDAIEAVKNGKVNILLVGSDHVAANTDTIVVITADTKNGKISLMSVPRDTRVNVGGSNRKINSVYSYAKTTNAKDEELLIDTVKEITGIHINYYAIIGLEAFREVVDALGGVEYDVPRDYDYEDPYQDLSIHIKKGKQILDGKNAEGLVRYRYDYPRADLERVEVQQSFIKELIKQKLKLEYVTKVPEVYRKVSKYVISNLTVADIMDYGKSIMGLGDGDLNSFTLPGEAKTIGGVSYFVCDEEETADLVEREF